MIATGSSPDAFQATSYLDLCPLNCSLPSSPPAALSEKLQNQHWRRWHLKIPPRESCQLGSCFSRVQNNISQSHQVRSISLDLSQLTKFRSYGIQKEPQFSKKCLECGSFTTQKQLQYLHEPCHSVDRHRRGITSPHVTKWCWFLNVVVW